MKLATVSKETLNKIKRQLEEDMEDGVHLMVMFGPQEGTLAHDSLRAMKGLLALYAERTTDGRVARQCLNMCEIIATFISNVFDTDDDDDPFADMDEETIN